jgi:glutathione peroxidase
MTTADKAKLVVATLMFRAKDLFLGGAAMAATPQQVAPAGKIYEFKLKTIDGKEQPLSAYKGQVALLVNTASLCGFTPQYEALEKLHEKYQERGLRVLGFPANEFGAQEPGSDSEIEDFCRTKYSIGFALFSKIAVKGPSIDPLYKFLTTESGFHGEVTWNFEKFLVDRHGKVVGRFKPADDPLGQKIVSAIEQAL